MRLDPSFGLMEAGAPGTGAGIGATVSGSRAAGRASIAAAAPGDAEPLESRLAELEFMREQLQSILDQREREFREQSARLVELQRHRDEAVAQLRRAEKRLLELEARLAERLDGPSGDEQRIRELEAERDALARQLETERRGQAEKVHGLEAECARTKTALLALQADHTRLRDDVAPAMAKAARHDRLMRVLPGWIEALLVRVGSRAG